MTLKPRQRKALEVLITTGEITQAAAAANVARKTVYAWLNEPEFKQALADAESLALESISRALLALGEQATDTLRAAMADKAAPAATRVRAADITLARLENMRQLAEFDARLKVIEENLRLGGKR